MRYETKSLAIALLISVAATATAPTVAAADASSVFDDATDAVGSLVDALIGAARGEYARLTDDPANRDADAAAADLQSEYNANSDELEDWINSRADATTDADALEIELTVGGDSTTVFLVADVNGSDYENSSIVDSTDRDVDEDCELEGAAARNAADELEGFVDETVDDDQDLSKRELARISRQYRGLVDCSFL
jgi:type II secretory pathway pseudopilin PulG